MCDKSQSPPTGMQLEHAIRRNFGGLDEQDFNSLNIFAEKLPVLEKEPDVRNYAGLSSEVSNLKNILFILTVNAHHCKIIATCSAKFLTTYIHM